MEVSLSIDHLVIMVDDLAQAIADYSVLGFTVLPGGVHADNPTHNALIVFADGVYIELIALQPGATTPASERLQKWLKARPGLVDMALLPSDIEANIAQARARGVEIEPARPGGRLRPDGQRIAWQTANLLGPGLPFFCADVTPHSRRVPEGAVRRHSNGVVGVAEVVIAVTDLALSREQYQALLGQAPQTPSDRSTLPEALTVTFRLGATRLTLAQPAGETSPLRAYLAAGGERPYQVTLATRQPAAPADLDLARTHRARLSLLSISE
jgi:catechol 2,3-dioxygenase-like lactoylglutathione lyase family enzyme